MRLSSSGIPQQPQEGEQKCLNSELWHACAGPLVSLPVVGSRVVYFPQGHSEQIAASTCKEVDNQIPNYPNLPPQLICQLHNVTMHADPETDEVYAQMTLQPLNPQEEKYPLLPSELGSASRQPTNYFCKTLTASDTSTHGGFSVPRRAAEKVFPPLDFSQQPPAQELIGRDLHGNEWKFRHVFRGQPKRHLLTTGWSVFVSAKRLVAGDSVLFIWNDNNQLLLGIRHANRPQTVMPSSVLSSDSMHIGLLAAAAHAAATNSRFTIFYNPRASPSEFVIPLAKYVKAVYHTSVSVGMRFRMLFETEESSVRRYMGTVTAIGDLDPVRWPNSHWRSVKVGWDESTAGEKQPRVSLWEIEPLRTFPMYPSIPLRFKRPWPAGLPTLDSGNNDFGPSSFMWLQDADRGMNSVNFQGFGITPWMQPRLDVSMLNSQPEIYQAMAAAALQEMRAVESSKLTSSPVTQFQQPQSSTSISTPLLTDHVLQQTQHQKSLFRTIHSQGQNQGPCQIVQNKLQQGKPFGDQPLQLQTSPMQEQQQQQQQQLLHQQIQQQPLPSNQLPNTISTLSQFNSASQSQSSSLQDISSFYHQNFLDVSVAPVPMSGVSAFHGILGSFSNEAANLLTLPRANPQTASGSWQTHKRLAVDPLLSSGIQPSEPQAEQLVSQANFFQQSVSLPPFPGRDCSVNQECNTEAESHQLFGLNLDSSSMIMQNGISNFRSIGGTDSTLMSVTSNGGSHFSSNQAFSNSNCLEELGFLQSSEKVDHVNPKSGTFVKVYKSGSFGRCLDITKFNSYRELRSELGRLFGLEGQLDDPLRSGWQLVFVDQENDVLLLGDDPWHEFVNNVWCIKILSPQEVQQMGKEGADLLSAAPAKSLSGSTFDDYVSRQDSTTSLSYGMASVGSLDY